MQSKCETDRIKREFGLTEARLMEFYCIVENIVL